MGGAIAALAIRDAFLVGHDARLLVHRTKLRLWLERAVGGQVTRPLDVHGAGDGASALRPDDRAVVFAVAAGIEDHDVGTAEPVFHVTPCCDRLLLRYAGPAALGRRRCLACHGQPGACPGTEAAVENLHARMPEVFEEPECAGGPHPRLLA